MGSSGNNCRKGMLLNFAVARGWRTLFIPACLCLVLLLAQQHCVYAAGFSATGNMKSDRRYHTSTTLADGRVLITGGTSGGTTQIYLKSAEIYDPVTGSFTVTGNMTSGRINHTATRLPDGKVLITGGYSGSAYVASAELFDPTTGTFTPTGSMDTMRANHTATLLNDGTVLVAGGDSGGSRSSTLATAQIYNPSTGTFSVTTGPLSVGRRFHTATLLNDGRVLFAGGEKAVGSPSTINSAEIYTPVSKTFATVAVTMNSARKYHIAALLSDGRVLLAGGYDHLTANIVKTAEIFDPTGAGTFSATAPMAAGRVNHTATRLLNGKVLVAGGYSTSTVISANAELFDPAGGSFVAAGAMTSVRAFHSAALINNGMVVISGGTEASYALFSAELYDPAAIKVSPVEHTFPDSYVSYPSIPQSFTITNSGPVDLTLNSIGFSGTDASMFTLDKASCGPLPHTLAATGGNCSISVNFIPTSGDFKSAALDITSSDPEKPVLSVLLSGYAHSLPPPPVTITVNFAGTGAGSTSSAVPELNCLSSSSDACQAQVDFGTVVTLSPAGGLDSLFTSWASTPASIDCSGSGICEFTADSDTSVTATFDYVKPARIGSTYYDSLQNAYADAFAGVGNVIEARDFSFTGPLVFDQYIDVRLKGGYDLTYSLNPDYSVLNGKFTIRNGSVTVERIVVRGGI